MISLRKTENSFHVVSDSRLSFYCIVSILDDPSMILVARTLTHILFGEKTQNKQIFLYLKNGASRVRQNRFRKKPPERTIKLS